MRSRAKWGIAAVLVAALAAGAWLVLRAPGTGGEPVQEEPAQNAPPQVVLEKVVHHATRGGRRVWTLVAQTLTISENGGQARATNADMTFYPADGPEIRVRAPEAQVDMNTQDAQLSGGVTVEDAGRVLEAQEMEYDAGARRILSRTPVRMRAPGLVLSADSMTYEMDTREARLDGHVQARFDGGLYEERHEN